MLHLLIFVFLCKCFFRIWDSETIQNGIWNFYWMMDLSTNLTHNHHNVHTYIFFSAPFMTKTFRRLRTKMFLQNFFCKKWFYLWFFFCIFSALFMTKNVPPFMKINALLNLLKNATRKSRNRRVLLWFICFILPEK